MKHALENAGEAVLYPSSLFQTVLSAFKKGLTLISVCAVKSAAKNPLSVQAEILGCTLILSHLSAQPFSAEILLLLGALGS